MRLSHATRRLRAAQDAQQERVFAAADRASLVADRAIAGLWAELLAVLRSTQGYARDYARLAAVLRRVGVTTADVLTRQLAGLYRFGYAGAAANALRSIPPMALRQRAGLREAVLPGVVSILPTGQSELSPLVAPLTDEPHTDRETQLDLLSQILFPPPSEDRLLGWLARFVRPADYHQVGTDSDRRMPETLAAQIAVGMSQGIGQRELAKELLPHLDGSRVRARRAARTFGIYTAHQGQNEAWDGLGDMVIGFQVFSAKVPDSRPWHKARHGRKYYLDPEAGQASMHQCPDPPLEPPDPAERPPGTPQVAFNCLCWRVPLLRPL